MAFYAKLGFAPFAGQPERNWVVLRNGEHVIGLFQGMFDRNVLTFDPGWDQSAQPLASFTDVRELQKRLNAEGVELVQEADASTTGPASFLVLDPDGNPGSSTGTAEAAVVAGWGRAARRSPHGRRNRATRAVGSSAVAEGGSR